jgi:hypothetical protein
VDPLVLLVLVLALVAPPRHVLLLILVVHEPVLLGLGRDTLGGGKRLPLGHRRRLRKLCIAQNFGVSEYAQVVYKKSDTHGLLAGESGLDGRQVCDHVVVDDPSPLRPEVVDEELDSIAGMFEESTFLVGPTGKGGSRLERVEGGS